MKPPAASRRPRIVVLDGYAMNPGDLGWTKLQCLGRLAIYERTPPEAIVERSAEAEILLINKVHLDALTLSQLPKLQLIVITASGKDNVDLQAAQQRQIEVRNAVGYGSEAVAQHVFALLLELTNAVGLHNRSVQEGAWAAQPDFSFWKKPLVELSGKTMGILGLGKIGNRVADIALAFGMEVLSAHRHPERDARPGVTFVDIDTLFRLSDVLTLHVPLTAETGKIVNAERLQAMPGHAFLINTGRGGLIDEPALRRALEENWIAGAGLDVLSLEPPKGGNVLLGAPNCLITPHLAWASRESRRRLLEISIEHVATFLKSRVQAA